MNDYEAMKQRIEQIESKIRTLELLNTQNRTMCFCSEHVCKGECVSIKKTGTPNTGRHIYQS